MAESEEPAVERDDQTLGLGAVVPLPEPADERERALIRARLKASMFARDETPARVGRFALLGRLGSGGMGVVYRAYDPTLEREVAVKLLHAEVRDDGDTRGRERLLREAQAMARLQHPNVVPVFEVGEHEDAVFVAMELVKGRTLARWLEQERAGWRVVLETFIAAGRGLAAAHAAGVVHRDFKPHNVLVGDDGRPRVLDFGLARHAEVGDASAAARPSATTDGPSALTRTGALVGTPAYMAPEQFEGGAIDARTDQFSFCVALYEALFGRRPFEGDTIEALTSSVLSGSPLEPPRGTKVPARPRSAILRGLARHADDRWPDMDALLAALAPPLRRTTAGLLGGAAILAAGLVAFAAVDDGPCPVPDAAELWNAERQATIAAGFERVPPGDGVARWPEVEPTIAARVQQFVDAREVACDGDDELAQRRRLCVARYRDRFEVMVALLEEGDQRVLESASGLVAALGDVAQCAGERPLAGIGAPAPEIADDVAALRSHIARGWALHVAGDAPDSRRIADEAVARARELGDRQVEAEALHLKFRAEHLDSVSFEEQARTAEAMAFAAEASGDASLVATAAAHLLEVGSAEDADAWDRRARAALERLGGDPRIESILVWGRGKRAQDRGDNEAALALFERAEALAPAADVLRTRCTVRIAENLLMLGELDAADAVADRALVDLHRLVRPTHPRIGWALKVLADIEAKRGHTERAIELALERARVLGRRYGDTHPDTLEALVHAIVSSGNVGMYDRTQELVRELRARTLPRETPAQVRQYAFALHVQSVLDFMGTGAARADFEAVGAALRDCGASCLDTRVNHLSFYARFLAGRGELAAAREKVEAARALRVGPDPIFAIHAAFVWLLSDDPQRALSELDAVDERRLPDAGSTGELQLTKSMALVQAGRPAETIPALEAALDNRHPVYRIYAAVALGHALRLTGADEARAQSLIDQALRDVLPGQRATVVRLDTLFGALTPVAAGGPP